MNPVEHGLEATISFTPRGTRGSRLLLAILLGALLLGTFPVTAAAQCTDGDGDGYGAPGDASCSSGSLTDCDDSDADIYPGAPEYCGSGVDENCDGSAAAQGGACAVGDPDLLTGPCYTEGTIACDADSSLATCLPNGAVNRFEDEGPAGSETCFDGQDNDCDGLTDHADDLECATDEVCNGFDDDNDGSIDEDFSQLGAPCVVGEGACINTGTFVCSTAGDGVTCSASPLVPGFEGPPSGGKCSDGIDNDCDGLVDVSDGDCQEADLCDGIDNDGDGVVDQDFVDLGQPCSEGTGACEVAGSYVCSADGFETTCDANPLAPTVETPSSGTCDDGIDNDCDGFVDGADGSCDPTQLAAWCALPYERGRPGSDCSGKHSVEFGVSGAGPDAEVSAELLALDAEGGVIDGIPVRSGDLAHLASRTDLDDYKLTSHGSRHQVFAPIPMLRITVREGANEAEAYCSPVPSLHVHEPDGGVTVGATDSSTRVVASLPLVDPATLSLLVDGVDVFSEMGIDPGSDFPGGPFDGQIEVGGQLVEVVGLVVEAAADLSSPSANTLRMELRNLPPGGHLVRLEGARVAGSLPDSPSAECHEDDLLDRAVSLVFGITIFSPSPGEILDEGPVRVIGRVSHGLPIAGVEINRRALDTSSQTEILGDGDTTANLYELPIDELLSPADVRNILDSNFDPGGTVDLGWNRLVLRATDTRENQVFLSRVFATAPLGGSTSAPLSAVATTAPGGLSPDFEVLPVSRALVFGLEESGVDDFFSSLCSRERVEIRGQISNAMTTFLNEFDGVSATTDLPSPLCDPRVGADLRSFQLVSPGPTCGATLGGDTLQLEITVPDSEFGFEGSGHCRVTASQCFGELGCIDVCIVEADLTVDGDITIENLRLDYEIHEDQLGSPMPSSITGTINPNDVGFDLENLDGDIDLGCLAAPAEDVANAALDGATFIGNELVDLIEDPTQGLIGSLQGFFELVHLDTLLDTIPAAPALPLRDIGIAFTEPNGMVRFSSSVDGADVRDGNPSGMNVSYAGMFEPLRIDPEVPVLEPLVLTPAPAPPAPQPGVELFFTLADDAYNQYFASATVAGAFERPAETIGTVGDVIPQDCASGATPYDRGYCHGLREADCETLDDGSGTPVAQGACHGAQENECSTLRGDDLFSEQLERETCRQTPGLGVSASTPLLADVRVQVPPRLLISDDPQTPNVVEMAVRLADLSVPVIADRDASGNAPSYSTLPVCGSSGDDRMQDCLFVEICTDVNLLSEATIVGNAEPELEITLVEAQRLANATLCAGPSTVVDFPGSQSTADQSVDRLLEATGERFVRFTLNGLTQQDLLILSDVRVIAVETDGSPSFQEYLGLGAQVAPAP